MSTFDEAFGDNMVGPIPREEQMEVYGRLLAWWEWG
jgi:hypothetical protein